MAIKIDTRLVMRTASQIADTNQQIYNDFSYAINSVNRLYNSWDSEAANVASSKFKKINNSYREQRYNVVNDLVRLMNSQVVEGYEHTETSAVNAAKSFK